MARDSITPDGQPRYWSQRYRLRGAVAAGSRSSQHDVPEFLNSSKEAIVVTGAPCSVGLWWCCQQRRSMLLRVGTAS